MIPNVLAQNMTIVFTLKEGLQHKMLFTFYGVNGSQGKDSICQHLGSIFYYEPFTKDESKL